MLVGLEYAARRLPQGSFEHWETAVGWYSDANQGHLFCRGPPGLPAGIGILARLIHNEGI